MTVSTDDDSVTGNLTVEQPAAGNLSALDIAGQGSNAVIVGGTDDEGIAVNLTNTGGQSGEFEVTFEITNGTVQVRENKTVTLGVGETERVGVERVTGELGIAVSRYTVTVSTDSTSITGTLAGWPDVNGNGLPANDTTGNGVLNDVDGNGEFDIFDVQLLFNTFQDSVVTEYPALFDFDENEPSDISIFDVQGLFNLLTEEF